MTMTTEVAQVRLTRELREAEEALDEALIRGSKLFTSLITARRDLGIASATGHDVLLRLTKTQQSLLSAGGDLARVHGGMIDIRREVTGDMARNCPPGQNTSFNENQAAA